MFIDFRYKNILPYDHSRVKLLKEIGVSGDYINASWMNMNSQEIKEEMYPGLKNHVCRNISFISSQGPLPNTCNRHLQLIFEQKVDAVVMLTQLVESVAGSKY